MNDQTNSKLPAAEGQSLPGKNAYILLAALLLINVLFLLYIVSRLPEDRETSLDEIKTRISNQKTEYEIEMHLSKYILLKMQIQKAIRDEKAAPSILEHINQAIHELEAVLSIPELKTSLDISKHEDLRDELNDMKKSRLFFQQKQKLNQ